MQNAHLEILWLDGFALDQKFQGGQPDYSADLGFPTTSVHLNVEAKESNASVRANDTLVGGSSIELALAEGPNLLTIVVTAEDGITTSTYTLTVTRRLSSSFGQTAYIKASNAERHDQFGESVVLLGNTLAVGATGEDSGTSNDADK